VEPCSAREIKFRFAALQKNIVAHAKTREIHGALTKPMAGWSVGTLVPVCAPNQLTRAGREDALLGPFAPFGPWRCRNRHCLSKKGADMKISLATAAMAILAATSFSSSPTAAQSLCGAREAVVDMLGTRYGETVRSLGLAGRDRIVEVFASDETGTWTILVTNTAGVLPRGFRTALRTAGRCPMVRLSDGWSLPLGLSAAPSPPC
jgi:hypothetical protein